MAVRQELIVLIRPGTEQLTVWPQVSSTVEAQDLLTSEGSYCILFQICFEQPIDSLSQAIKEPSSVWPSTAVQVRFAKQVLSAHETPGGFVPLESS